MNTLPASSTHLVKVTTSITTAPEPPSPTGGPVRFVLGNGLLLAWLAGALVVLIRLLAGAAQLWRWKRHSLPLGDARTQALARQIAAEYRLSRLVELRTLASCRVPMTWGTLRPVVLLPAEAEVWPAARLALVLRHELGHIARHDCLTRLLTQFATALYWPNPLVWLAARIMRLTQEQACDDLVLAAGTPAETYALELVASTRHLQGRAQPAPAVAMGEPSTLGRRIESIIGPSRDRRPFSRVKAGLISALAAVALIGFASVQLRGADETKPAQSNPGASPAAAVSSDTPTKAPKTTTTLANAARSQPVQVAIEATFIKVGQGEFEFKDLSQYGAASSGPGKPGENQWIGRLDVPAVLQVLARKPGYEMVSKPAISILSGNMTKMMVAQELRYPQSYSETGAPQEFTTRSIGVELLGTPVVEDDGHTIDFDLSAHMTDFDGFIQYGEKNIQPLISVREMTTKVSLQDGATLIMGGLTLSEKKTGGDVPTMGGIEKLLKGNGDSTTKRTLVIFITLRIVKQDEVAKK